MKMKDSEESAVLCDLRLPMHLQCLDTNFQVALYHIVNDKKDMSMWAIFPVDADPNSKTIKFCERLNVEEVAVLLSCLVVEYAEMLKNPELDDKSKEYFEKIRGFTIETIEKFFPAAANTLAELRLSDVQSQAYQHLFKQVFIHRVFIAGRLFQYYAERSVDEDMANESDVN